MKLTTSYSLTNIYIHPPQKKNKKKKKNQHSVDFIYTELFTRNI